MKIKSKSKKKTSHDSSPRVEAELAISKVIRPQQEMYTTVYHAVNPGDLMAAMGSIKKYYEITKRKILLYQNTDQKAQYYAGATHPTVNSNGENVCVNEPMFEMLKPLIESQDYIHLFEKYRGQGVDLDFNIVRGKTNVNLPNGSIQGWIPFAFPDLWFDISKPWVILDDNNCPEYIAEQVNGKVLLNFTERYRNHMIDYFFLKNYAPDLIFAGKEKEYWDFCNRFQLSIPRLEVNNFLDLAYAIKRSRFILANQSFCVNIAYAIGSPRITEICSYAQNVIHMVGDECHGFLHQAGAEYHFRRLYNVTFSKR